MTTEADERAADESSNADAIAETQPPETATTEDPAPAQAAAEAPARRGSRPGARLRPRLAADATPAEAEAETEAPAEAAADARGRAETEAPADAKAQGEKKPKGEAKAQGKKKPKREAKAPGEKQPEGEAKKPRRRKPRERRKPAPDLPRTRAPLPLDELRDASRSTMNLFGARQALREALGILAPRERQELNVLVAADDDHRPRARNIANGSLGAGRIDKAMAATIVSMAPQEELWNLLLDKEQAAQKLGRIRQAKQRDKQRADRAAERANRADRVSREDMDKATDGRVGATIRFVTDDKKRERKPKEPAKPDPGESVLDRLGY